MGEERDRERIHTDLLSTVVFQRSRGTWKRRGEREREIDRYREMERLYCYMDVWVEDDKLTGGDQIRDSGLRKLREPQGSVD